MDISTFTSVNPSAPTSIGSGSLTYDTNGNLTAYNATKYTWDYRNRVTAIGNGTATTTFAYDHTFERVKKVSGGVSTYYINDLYNKAGATTTIYIYDNTGTLIATIEGNGTATTTEYQHQDHLGGTNVITKGNVGSHDRDSKSLFYFIVIIISRKGKREEDDDSYVLQYFVTFYGKTCIKNENTLCRRWYGRTFLSSY